MFASLMSLQESRNRQVHVNLIPDCVFLKTEDIRFVLTRASAMSYSYWQPFSSADKIYLFYWRLYVYFYCISPGQPAIYVG